MTENTGKKLSKLISLAQFQLVEIENLRKICNDYEHLNLKLKMDWLHTPSTNNTNYFLFYQDDGLVGFLGLYGFGTELQITGMVQPEYRHKGIFRALFSEAILECKKRDVRQVLLIAEHASADGTKFAQARGGDCIFSECRMEFQGSDASKIESYLTLEEATPADLPTLAHIHAVCFNATGNAALVIKMLQKEGNSSYLAKLNGVTVGKLGLSKEGDGIYIRGVAILPEYRRRGYGRQMLSKVIQKMLAERFTHLILDVQISNSNALRLYQSCGFQESTIYNYFRVVLGVPQTMILLAEP